MRKTKLSFSLPFIVDCDDYHSFEQLKEFLGELTNQNIKVKEITPQDIEEFTGKYIGLVYIGKKPNKEQIKKLETIYF